MSGVPELEQTEARPAQKVCVLCRWAPRDGTDVAGACAKCRGRYVADLADLPELFDTLAVQLAPGAHAESQRVSGSSAPPIPVRLDVLNLRGRANAGLPAGGPDQHGPLSIATVLAVAAISVRQVCGLTDDPDRRVRLSVRAQILADVQTCTRHADTYAAHAHPERLRRNWQAVHDARERAWSAAGYRAYRLQLGDCPTPVDGQPCGAELWVDPVLDAEVHCRVCGTTWGRRHFLWLRRIGGDT